MSTLGKRIKNCRKEKGFSQNDLAEACGVFQKNISDYESDKTIPYADVLRLIAEKLEVSADFLLGMVSEQIDDISFSKIVKQLNQLPSKEQEAFKTLIASLTKNPKKKG
jgi:transcriptional regulator with XRE-family HTH domain